MKLQYFGTDGIRGRAFDSPLTFEEVNRWGQSWTRIARLKGIEEFVIGWDPRISSEPLVKAFLSGVNQEIRKCILGVVPTPAVAYITSTKPLAWGIMFSASHNPPEDNGIKGFNSKGEKLSDKDELDLEVEFKKNSTNEKLINNVDLTTNCEIINTYINHLVGIEIPRDISIVIDCANGATAPWAPNLFKGNNIHWLGTPADGNKINIESGSSNVKQLSNKVITTKADIGIAFDGDGDRCVIIDSSGNLIDGDQILWLLVRNSHKNCQLPPGVVGTIMSNSGLEEALLSIGIKFIRTAVGDKHMLRELAKRNWTMAAESSGHVIQKDISPSGDGMATAIAVIKILLNYSLSNRWSWKFKEWRMALVNIKTKNYKPVSSCLNLLKAINSLEVKYEKSIRIITRWSGTEAKLRLMVEGKNPMTTLLAIKYLEKAAKVDLNILND